MNTSDKINKKNIYFCEFNKNMLPYTIGIINSFLSKSEYINDNYNINLLYEKKEICNVINKLETPEYIFFLVNIWNYNYSLQVAKLAKEKYPDTKIVLGGHSTPYYEFHYFDKYPFIDILVYGDGEVVCKQILLGDSLFYIKNITFKKYGKAISTGRYYDKTDVNILPSPYLNGIFDSFDKRNAILETNRGCKCNCLYCDLGNDLILNNKIRRFDKQRVLQEIEWFGKNKVKNVYCIDANFGIFQDDIDYIDKVIEVKREYGYPKKFKISSKYANSFTAEIYKKLEETGLLNKRKVTLPTLSKKPLGIIKRNIDITNLKKDVSVELFTGLPGETIDSYKECISKLLRSGRNNIIIKQCRMFPNCRLNTEEFRKMYNIKTALIPLDNGEEKEIIIETKDLSKEALIEVNLYSYFVSLLHSYGLCQFISNYLYKKYNINYRELYETILSYGFNYKSSVLGKEINRAYKIISEEYTLPDVKISFLVYISNLELFYRDILDAILQRYNLEEEELVNLICFNRFILKTPIAGIGNYYINEYVKEFLKFYGKKINAKHIYIEKEIRYSNIEDYIDRIEFGDTLYKVGNIKGSDIE